MLSKNAITLLLLCLICLTGCGKEISDAESVVNIDAKHVLYEHFLTACGNKEPLLTGVNDINNDGLEDLIVIYRDTAATNKMVAIWQEGGKVIISDPTLAPIENYRIEWRDIDDKEPIELIVSGSKGVNVGYAIYRWENGDFINLFGEGMEDCC